MDSIISLRTELRESLQEETSQFSMKNIFLMGQEPTESKALYVIRHLYLRGVLESTAVLAKEIKLDDPLRPLTTNKISLFYETSVTPNHMRITTSKFLPFFSLLLLQSITVQMLCKQNS